MPELPEVETVKRQLQKQIIGKKILALESSKFKLRKVIEIEKISNSLEKQKFSEILRRGKYLFIRSSNDFYLMVHLGMSGTMRYEQQRNHEKHTHFQIKFEDGSFLSYNDPRRFGQISIFKDPFKEKDSPLLNLGPEPFGIDPEEFIKEIAKSERKSKDYLLDQRKIAGLGNIYVLEALFLTGISPNRKIKRCQKKAKELLLNIEKVLNSGIENNGTTFSDYRDLAGFRGLNENHLYVFNREGLECKICKSTIKRIKQGGRSSFYCPKCQN